MARPLFISHSSDDADAATRLCDAIEDAGLRCWIAPRDIAVGEDWASAITKALETCAGVVVVVSRSSLASQQVVREVNLADSRSRPILPVRIDHAQLSGRLQFFLSTAQWADATGSGGIERLGPQIVHWFGGQAPKPDPAVDIHTLPANPDDWSRNKWNLRLRKLFRRPDLGSRGR